jgi:hypothetical protein
MKLIKTRSKYDISFVLEASEPFFSRIIKIEKSTGKILKNSMIVTKDVQEWVEWLLRSGWKVSS